MESLTDMKRAALLRQAKELAESLKAKEGKIVVPVDVDDEDLELFRGALLAEGADLNRIEFRHWGLPADGGGNVEWVLGMQERDELRAEVGRLTHERSDLLRVLGIAIEKLGGELRISEGARMRTGPDAIEIETFEDFPSRDLVVRSRRR